MAPSRQILEPLSHQPKDFQITLKMDGPNLCDQCQARRVSSPPSFAASHHHAKQRLSQEPRRHSWPIPSPIRPAIESSEAFHARNGISLCKALAEVASSMVKLLDDLNQRLNDLRTPAIYKAAAGLSSLARKCATLRLELDNLRATAGGSGIPHLSSFWVQCWKVVYDVSQRRSLLKDIFFDLDADNKIRQTGCQKCCHPDRIEGYSTLGQFLRDVEKAGIMYDRTSRSIREAIRQGVSLKERGKLGA